MDAQIKNQMVELRAKLGVFDIASKVDPVSMEQLPFQYTDSDGNDWVLINGQGIFPLLNEVAGFFEAKANYVYPEDLSFANANISRLFRWNILAMAKAWIDTARRLNWERRYQGRGLFWIIKDAEGKNQKIRLGIVSKLHLSFARYENKRNGDTVLHSVITDRRLVPLSYRQFTVERNEGIKDIKFLSDLDDEAVLLSTDPYYYSSVHKLGDISVTDELNTNRAISIMARKRVE